MTDQQPKRSNRKLKAILAGGLVLGVGAAITLAAWNDSEFATGTFTAGQFNLEGSTDNTTWDDHDTAPGATLDFTLAPDNLSPDDVVYAAFAVRLDDTTTSDGTATLSADTTGNTTGLTYGLVTTAAFGCDETAYDNGTALVATGTALGTAAGTFPLTAGAGADPGAPVYLCYEVTAGATLTQGQTATATWEFAAESD